MFVGFQLSKIARFLIVHSKLFLGLSFADKEIRVETFEFPKNFLPAGVIRERLLNLFRPALKF